VTYNILEILTVKIADGNRSGQHTSLVARSTRLSYIHRPHYATCRLSVCLSGRLARPRKRNNTPYASGWLMSRSITFCWSDQIVQIEPSTTLSIANSNSPTLVYN